MSSDVQPLISTDENVAVTETDQSSSRKQYFCSLPVELLNGDLEQILIVFDCHYKPIE